MSNVSYDRHMCPIITMIIMLLKMRVIKFEHIGGLHIPNIVGAYCYRLDQRKLIYPRF